MIIDGMQALGEAFAPEDSAREWRLGTVEAVSFGSSPPYLTVDGRPMRWISGTYVPKVGDVVVWVNIGADPVVIGRRASAPVDSAFPLTSVRRTTTQSIGTTALTALVADVEDVDDAGLHSLGVNPGRFTIPANYGGRWQISASVTWATGLNGNSTMLYLNFSGIVRRDLASATETTGTVASAAAGTIIADMAAGSYVFAEVFQSTGVSRDVASAWLQAVYLGRTP